MVGTPATAGELLASPVGIGVYVAFRYTIVNVFCLCNVDAPYRLGGDLRATIRSEDATCLTDNGCRDGMLPRTIVIGGIVGFDFN